MMGTTGEREREREREKERERERERDGWNGMQWVRMSDMQLPTYGGAKLCVSNLGGTAHYHMRHVTRSRVC